MRIGHKNYGERLGEFVHDWKGQSFTCRSVEKARTPSGKEHHQAIYQLIALQDDQNTTKHRNERLQSKADLEDWVVYAAEHSMWTAEGAGQGARGSRRRAAVQRAGLGSSICES